MPRGNAHQRFEKRMAYRAAIRVEPPKKPPKPNPRNLTKLLKPRWQQSWDEFEEAIQREKRIEHFKEMWRRIEDGPIDHFYPNRPCYAVSACLGSGDGHVIRKSLTHERPWSS